VARRLRDDLSASAAAAGFVAVLVGFTSSVPLVFQAARAFGATPEQIGSWIFALGLGMGSPASRCPCVTACRWSRRGPRRARRC
jgi:predicted benzoate:H+ symporter BenE